MANDTRVRTNGVAGAIKTTGMNNTSDVTLNSDGLADLPAIGSTQHAVITLFKTDATTGQWTQKEIVYVTAHTASAASATVTRAQDGTSKQTWAVGDKWVHGAVTGDFRNRDRRWDPGTIVVSDQNDEFNDDSLDTAWARVDVSGGTGRAVWTEGADSLSLRLTGGDSAAETHALVRSYALAVGESVECHVTAIGYPENYSFAGLIVADGNTYTAGTQIFFPFWNTGSNQNPEYAIWTGYNNRSAFTDVAGPSWGYSLHMRLKRDSSNVWRYSVSADGVEWFEVGTRTQSLTPAYVGFAGGTWTGSNTHLFSFDYFRVV